MLDRLPVELVSHVVEYTLNTHKERRQTLGSVSLVCSAFRDVAQPMLLELFLANAEKATQSLAFKQDGRSRGSRVKLLVLSSLGGQTINEILRLCPNVEELNVEGCSFEMKFLGRLPTLALFDLREADLSPAPLLDPALSSQLDVIFLDVAATRLKNPPLALPPLSRIRLHHYLATVHDISPPEQRFSPVHLSFPKNGFPGFAHTHNNHSPETIQAQLRTFVASIQSLSTLRTLDLPECFHPVEALGAEYDSLRAELLQHCADRGIEVTWSPPPSRDESRVCRAFWRRVRERDDWHEERRAEA
ncbi:hypothetical protein JCM6882_005014 [Rhodosporidiobolus microsporus]